LAEVVKDIVGNKPVILALTHGHGDHWRVKFSEVFIHPADSAS
jgi:hypothetical protein